MPKENPPMAGFLLAEQSQTFFLATEGTEITEKKMT